MLLLLYDYNDAYLVILSRKMGMTRTIDKWTLKYGTQSLLYYNVIIKKKNITPAQFKKKCKTKNSNTNLKQKQKTHPF